MRVKLTVAYDGTDYCGWQIQPNGITIEQVLNEALSDLFGQNIRVHGASRTDSGVHSMGNIAYFDVDTRMDVSKICFALNQRLPEDISVLSSEQAADDYNPHDMDSVKTYEYRILSCTHRNPIRRRYTYFYHYPLDVEAMDKAAQYLVGEHDFTSFASVKSQVNSFVRTLYEVRVCRDGDEIVIRCVGNGFLYNMVRIIAGTLIEVGCGRRKPENIPEILAGCDRELAGPTAPPEGLTMVSWKER